MLSGDKFSLWWEKHSDEYSALLLDIDGTIIMGNNPIDGASDFIRTLKKSGFPFILLTNDAIRSPEEKAEILNGAGFELDTEDIVSCGDSIEIVIRERALSGEKFFMMGKLGIPNYAVKHGLKITETLSEIGGCSGVIVGELNYDWESCIVAAVNFFIRKPEAHLIVPNPDSVWRTGVGNDINIGAGGVGRFIRAILKEYGLDKEPIYLGKPYRMIYEYTLNKLSKSISPGKASDIKRILSVGDSLKSDIAGASAMGFSSALLMTGVTTPQSLENSVLKPDFSFKSI